MGHDAVSSVEEPQTAARLAACTGTDGDAVASIHPWTGTTTNAAASAGEWNWNDLAGYSIA